MGDKYLLTGSSGFLGASFLKAFIHKENVQLDTLSRNKATYSVDLTTFSGSINTAYKQVIHAAGAAHNKVLDPEKLAAVNIQGTQNLLNSLSAHPPHQFVFISTVAVYGLSSGQNITENTPTHPNTVYGESKLKAEKLVLQWAKKHKVKTLILRLPLLVGENPPGNLGSMISGLKSGRYFRIGKGAVAKSMVLADDVSKFVCENPQAEGIYHLTDGVHPTFSQLENHLAQLLHCKPPNQIPYFVAKLVALLGGWLPGFPLTLDKLNKLTSPLTFSDDKVRKDWAWNPRSVLQTNFL